MLVSEVEPNSEQTIEPESLPPVLSSMGAVKVVKTEGGTALFIDLTHQNSNEYQQNCQLFC